MRLSFPAGFTRSTFVILFVLLLVDFASVAADDRVRLVVSDTRLADSLRQVADESFLVDKMLWRTNSPNGPEVFCHSEADRSLERTVFVFSACESDLESDAWRERLTNQGYRTIVVPSPRSERGEYGRHERLRVAHETLATLCPQRRSALEVRLWQARCQLHLLTWSTFE